METDAVFGPDFFGRRDVLDVLEKRVQAFLKGYRQNVGIIGRKSIGKSSILRQFLLNLRESSLIPVYIEIIPEPFEYTARKFMGSLLASYLEVRGEPVPPQFDTLVKRTRRILPRTLKKMSEIMRILGRQNRDAAFKEMLSLTHLLQEESGSKVLVALDNFEHVEELRLKDPYREFSNAIMMQKDTLYFVSVGKARRAHRIFRERLSLLFGNFEVLELGPFDFQTSQSFLENRLPGVLVPDHTRKFLMELTDGHPYFLGVLSDRLRAVLREGLEAHLADSRLGPSAHALGLQGGSETGSFAVPPGRRRDCEKPASSPELARGPQPQHSPEVQAPGEWPSDTDRCDRNHRARSLDEILVQALEQELYQRKGCLHQYFVMGLRSLGNARLLHASLKVLLAIALGHKKDHQIARYLRRKVTEVRQILTKLVEEEMISKKGSFYVIDTPIFRFWLRHVYYPRELALPGQRDDSVSVFRNGVMEMIKNRGEEEQKELMKRVEELFRQFRNDVVEVESKAIRCPHFTEVLFKPSNGRVFPVEAKSHTSRWVCQVACKKVTEEDVQSFIHDIQKLRRKVQRKMMITLQGIELNAKLLAKEAKILLWSLKDFNALLELYDRPKVIASS